MPTTTDIRTTRRPRGALRPIVGLVVVAVGVLLLLNTTGVYETRVWDFVPSLVILWGLSLLVRDRLVHVFWPLTLVAAGTAWQLVTLGYTTWEAVFAYWPVLLIALGLSILFGVLRRGPGSTWRDDLPRGIVIGTDDDLRADDVAGDDDLVAILGRSTLDFTDESVAPPTSLDAVAVFGTAEIRVPADWDVKTGGVGVFGRFRDERSSRPPRKAVPDLIVEGVAVFGSVSIVD